MENKYDIFIASTNSSQIHVGFSVSYRKRKGVLSGVYVSSSLCSSANDAGFVGFRTNVHGAMNLCSFRKTNKEQDTSVTL